MMPATAGISSPWRSLGFSYSWSRRVLRARGPAPRWALVVLATLTLGLGIKLVSQRRAVAVYEIQRAELGELGGEAVLAAVPNSARCWVFFNRHGRRLSSWSVDAISGQMELRFERDAGGDTAVTAAVSLLPVVQNLKRVARLPFVHVEPEGELHVVLWTDLPSCGAEDCDLGFGAELDERLSPLTQLVRIGPLNQRREIPSR